MLFIGSLRGYLFSTSFISEALVRNSRFRATRSYIIQAVEVTTTLFAEEQPSQELNQPFRTKERFEQAMLRFPSQIFGEVIVSRLRRFDALLPNLKRFVVDWR